MPRLRSQACHRHGHALLRCDRCRSQRHVHSKKPRQHGQHAVPKGVANWYGNGSNGLKDEAASSFRASAGWGSGVPRGQGWWQQDQGNPPVHGPGMPPRHHLAGNATVGFVQIDQRPRASTAAVDGHGGCRGGRGRHVALRSPHARARTHTRWQQLAPARGRRGGRRRWNGGWPRQGRKSKRRPTCPRSKRARGRGRQGPWTQWSAVSPCCTSLIALHMRMPTHPHAHVTQTLAARK